MGESIFPIGFSMKKFSNHFGRHFWKKFSLKSTRSAPIISSEKIQENSNRNSQLINQRKPISSLTNIKSAVVLHNRTMPQESHEHLDAMNRIVDETDENLRRALEHAVVRREQLDELHNRSEEMLQKNENLVFGKGKRFSSLSNICRVHILSMSQEISSRR